ncbi:MAG: GspE/PulE family protein [Actinomycetota bacterium]
MKLRRGPEETDAGVLAPVAPTPPNGARRIPQPPGSPSLGDILVGEGALSAADFDAARTEHQRTNRPLEEILVRQGVDERRVAAALARQYGVAVVDLRTTTPEPTALARLDSSVARRLRALTVKASGDRLAIAVDAVPTVDALTEMQRTTGCIVAWVLATPTDLTRSLDRSYRATEDVGDLVRAFEIGESGRAAVSGPTVEIDDMDAPVIQIVTRLLTEAVRDNASDIHLEPTEGGLRVRMRFDGALHDSVTLPSAMAQSLASRIKIMADMNIVERRRAQDGQFEFEVDGRALDVRVATAATIWGEKVVMRVLDRSRSLLEMPALGMRPDTARRFRALVHSPFGMVICAGPTGSGKTTTLYAAISEINNPEVNITTIEDPVEYVFPSINQIQINEQADVTFAGGLKAILRQDPDIILVGEIRDVETARIAVQSALTGHLVLSSLHATDAALALQRLLDMGIEAFLVAAAINGVVGQRLLRRVCSHCAEEYVPAAEERAFYERNAREPAGRFVRGAGCNLCGNTGYLGRIGAYELLNVTDEIRELVVTHASHDRLRETAVSQGMRTLLDESLGLVRDGVTTIGEVIRRVYAV